MPAYGTYTLALYCDNFDDNPSDTSVHEYGEFPHEYVDEMGSVCRAMARRAGWLISDERVLCPKCSGKRGK